MKHTFVRMFRDSWTRYTVLLRCLWETGFVFLWFGPTVHGLCCSSVSQTDFSSNSGRILCCVRNMCVSSHYLSPSNFNFLFSLSLSLSVSHLCLSFSAGELWTADAGGGLEGMNLWAHSCYVENQPASSFVFKLSIVHFKKEQDGGVLYYIKKGSLVLSRYPVFCVDSKCTLVGNRER